MEDQIAIISVVSSSFTEKGVPARLTTFIFSLLVALFSTYVVQPAKGKDNTA